MYKHIFLFAWLLATLVGCSESTFSSEQRNRSQDARVVQPNGDPVAEDPENKTDSTTNQGIEGGEAEAGDPEAGNPEGDTEGEDDTTAGGSTAGGGSDDISGGDVGGSTSVISEHVDSNGDGIVDVDHDEVILGKVVQKIGAAFEDSTDDGDWKTKDVFVCITGQFTVDANRTVKASSKMKQNVQIATATGGACKHKIYVRVYDQKGKMRHDMNFESRGVNKVIELPWYYGDRVEVSMKSYYEDEEDQCLPVGEILHTNTSTKPVRVQWFGEGICPI